ncbi:inositol monophosphatase family protein [Floccifex sp.]|uniref:inositol monophosphatase family protein n=1 Tax=Floccifex sp. TaxID=2815810 RepID=UPI003F04D7F1
MKDILEIVIEIAREAGQIFKNNRNFEIHEKTDISNIVTSMDVQIQNQVIQKLLNCPIDACIYAEEQGKQEMNEGYVWVIDPIDGTTNYAYDYKWSCISIALLFQKQVQIGVIYNPYLDEVFYAQKNKGAYCNGNRIHVTNHFLKNSICAIGTSPYYPELMDISFNRIKALFSYSKDIRRSGSAALDLCSLASGRVDAFYEQRLSPWDFAAGSLIIQEAGGIIESLEEFSFENNISIVAGNSNNFQEIVDTIKKA